jgi:acetoin utilization protein AcuB
MRIGEIMTRKVHTVGFDDDAEYAWDQMKFGRHRHLVVLAGSRVAGVLSDRDLGASEEAGLLRRGKLVKELMSQKPVTATENTTVREAANLMRGHIIDCLPVVDDKNHLVGIVTTYDILNIFATGAERPTKNSKAKRWSMRDRGPHRKRSRGQGRR